MSEMATGQKVRSRRTELSVTRERLAVDIGISVSTLVRLENHNRIPKRHTLSAIAEYLEMPIEELVEQTTEATRRAAS